MAVARNELGRTGLSAWAGVVQEDFLKELRGTEGYKRYTEMALNSPVIGAMLTAIEQSIRAVDFVWASDVEEGQPDVGLELLNAADDYMSQTLMEHLIETLSMLTYGWSYFEIVYQQVPEYTHPVWRKFAIRGQNTLYKWLLDDHDGLEGMEQRLDQKPWRATLPIEKCLLYRTRVSKGNPEGRSILRTSWTSYYYVKHLQQIEAIGEERGLAGVPMIKLPPSATTDENDASSDASKAAEMVRNIRRDEQEGIVLPDGWEVDLLSTGATRAFATDNVIKRHESRMLTATLTQFLLLGQDRVGALATFQGGMDFFTMSINTLADIVAQTITKYAIPRLFALHGIPVEGHRLEHPPVGAHDVVAIGDFLQKVGAKVTWTAEDERWLRSVGDLPELSLEQIEDEREKKAAERPAFPPFAPRPPGQPGMDADNTTGDEAFWFVADNAPDDDERRRHERGWKRRLDGYLDAARARVTGAAKGLQ